MSSSSTFVAAAIDFGTTYSGYGYSFKSDPTNIVLHKWDQTGLTSLKTPTTLLLKKNEDSGGEHYKDDFLFYLFFFIYTIFIEGNTFSFES